MPSCFFARYNLLAIKTSIFSPIINDKKINIPVAFIFKKNNQLKNNSFRGIFLLFTKVYNKRDIKYIL